MKTGSLLFAILLILTGEIVYGQTIYRGNSGDLTGLAIEPFRGRVTGNAFGAWSSLDGKNYSGLDSGFRTSQFGGSLGTDYQPGKYVLWGWALHGTSIDFKPDDSRYDGDLSSFAGDLHASIFDTLWHCDLSVGFGRNRNTNRFSQGDESFRNKFDANQWNYKLDAGLRIHQGYTRIEPFIGFHFSTLNEPGSAGRYSPTSETPFSSSGQVSSSYRLLLGSRFGWEYTTYLGTITPGFKIYWLHEFGDEDLFTTNDQLGFPVIYRFAGNSLSRDRIGLNAGVTLALRDSLDLFFHYNTLTNSRYSENLILGGFNKKF